MRVSKIIKFIDFLLIVLIFLSSCNKNVNEIGQKEAIRVYLEYADGKDRGMFDSNTNSKGFQDENFDATTTMVVNWHRLSEVDPGKNARLKYRRVFPSNSSWLIADGNSFNFWNRTELINRVILKNLSPNSIYEFKVKENGEIFRFRTMPSELEDRPVKIVVASDLQSPDWNYPALEIAKMAAFQEPDLFVGVGDFLNTNGDPNSLKAANDWAHYLDILYGVNNGYFFYDLKIDGKVYKNIIIPHMVVVGNHDVEGQLMHPRDVNTTGEPKYPKFTGPNWLELLFHFPFSSEGFSSEVNPVHPNINNQTLVNGFNKGGFGSMSFGDYLLIIDLNNIQFWEGEPNSELRDWKGDLITDKWPWYGQIQSDVRQDLWLKHTLENHSYKHIIPFYHRGLFGGTRLNMSHKNRDILKYWLPLFYKYNVKFITEAHDHLYKRTVPLKISNSQPKDTYMEQLPYKPLSWDLIGVPETYLEDYYTVNCIKNNETHEIVGWEYDGNYITYDKQGFIVQGDGGWAAGRRNKGDRQAGNAGWWFVDKSRGGEIIDGKDSYYLTVINLSNNEIEIESFHPNKLINFQNGKLPFPMKKVKWDFDSLRWYAFDIKKDKWLKYVIEE